MDGGWSRLGPRLVTSGDPTSAGKQRAEEILLARSCTWAGSVAAEPLKRDGAAGTSMALVREDRSELSSFGESLVPGDVRWVTSEWFFLGSPTVTVKVI